MRYTINQENTATVFTLHESALGENISAELKAEFLLQCPAEGAFIVDLSGVKTCDTDGVSSLLVAHRELESNGRNLKIVGANADVMRVLRLSQLDKRFEFYDSLHEAHASLKSARRAKSTSRTRAKRIRSSPAASRGIRTSKTTKRKK